MGKFNFFVGVLAEIKISVFLHGMVCMWELLVWETL